MRVWRNLLGKDDKIHADNIIGGTREKPISVGNFIIANVHDWSGDFNKTTIAGMYRIGGSSQHTNGPPVNSVNYGQLLVVRGGADTCAQIVFSYQNNTIWYRSGSGATDDNFANPRGWVSITL